MAALPVFPNWPPDMDSDCSEIFYESDIELQSDNDGEGLELFSESVKRLPVPLPTPCRSSLQPKQGRLLAAPFYLQSQLVPYWHQECEA